MALPSGWQQLLLGWPWFQGEGNYPLPAYSEFLPPPRLGRRAYSAANLPNFDESDPFGWPVSEGGTRTKGESSMTKVPRSASISAAASRLPSFQPPEKGLAPIAATIAATTTTPRAAQVQRRSWLDMSTSSPLTRRE